MAVADTARLVAALDLDDTKFQAGINRSIGSMSKLEGESSKVAQASQKISTSQVATARSSGLAATGFGRISSAARGAAGVVTTLGGKISTIASGALGSLGSLAGRAGGLLRSGFSAATGAVGRFGDALGHAKGRLLGLLSGPLGLLGLGGGLLSIVGLFKSGVNEVKDFAGEVNTLVKVTGLSAEQASLLAGALHHFNIEGETAAKIAGLAEKNLGLLSTASTKGGASADQLARAQERVRLATLKLAEVESKSHATGSQRLAAQQRLADAERTLAALQGKTATSSSQAAAFQKQYGLQILDSSGKVKNFNDLLLASADFFNNKSIPAQTKAVALSKIYGKSWQDLLPVLSAGRKGIAEAEAEAQKLGLTLTTDNLSQLRELKNATRDWGTAFGGLKLQIGLVAIPLLTNLFKGATGFIADNRVKIVGFFRDVGDAAKTAITVFAPLASGIAATFSAISAGTSGLSISKILGDSTNFAKDLGSVLKGTVVPAINAVIGAWNSLPGQLRQLLIEGFIANKIVKWTFGFDAIGFGKELAGSFIANVGGKITATLAGEGIAGALAKVGIGKTFVQPVFVTNEGFGGLGKAGGAVGVAEGVATAAGSGIAASLALSVGALGLILASPIIANWLARNHILGASLPGEGDNVGLRPSRTGPIARPNSAAPRAGGPASDAPLGEHALDRAVDATNKANAILGRGIQEGHRDTDKLDASANKIASGVLGLHPALDALHVDFAKNIAAVKASKDPKKDAAAIAAAIKDLGKGVGSVKTTEGVLEELRRLRAIAVTNGDKADVRILDRDIKVATDKLNFRRQIDAQLHKADAIVRSSESTKNKIRDLEAVEKAIGGRSHAATARVEAAIKRLKLTTSVRITNSVTVFAATGKVHTVGTTVVDASGHPVGDSGGGGRQHGGPVAVGRLYEVNEGQGQREFFEPFVAGRVHPKMPAAHRMLAALAGSQRATGGPLLPGVTLVGERQPELLRSTSSSYRIDTISQFREYLADLVERAVQIPRDYRAQRERVPVLQASFGPVEAFVSTANIKRKTTRVRRFGEQFA